ncbi:MAG TPA: gliding motility-associated C-terminal domain-containing protein [Flavipsychrobacter sp.]|nr:gliding motility-associated C-terminal domain-containing protein [Flavipsychrobacter sp.]
MRYFRLFTIIITAQTVVALSALQATAQLDSCNVFLQGKHIEVGINVNGAFGSSVQGPSGYHGRTTGASMQQSCGSIGGCYSGTLGVGFVADPDKDGWTVGTPTYIGDYFLPGDPQEGWAIQINGKRTNFFNGSGYATCGVNPIPTNATGTNLSYANDGKSVTGEWQGTVDNLVTINQETTLDSGNVFFTMYITVYNNTSDTLHNLYYLREVDPDNDVMDAPSSFTGNAYETYNYIPYQLPNPQNRTLVAALGAAYPKKSFLGLGTLDCRARCFILQGGLTPPDGDSLDTMFNSYNILDHDSYDSTYYYYTGTHTDSTKIIGYNPETGKPIYGSAYNYYYNDVGIGLVFNLGDLMPNDSMTFAYAYVLREADLDSAFQSTLPKWKNGDDTSASFGGYLTGHGMSVCKNSVVPLKITRGGYYHWTWYASNTNGFDSTVVVANYMGNPNDKNLTVLDSLAGPESGLDTNHGLTNKITMGSQPRTIIAIGVSQACVPDTIVMHLIPNLSPPPRVTPTVYYCQHSKPAQLTAEGTFLRWYKSLSGDTGSVTPPTPSTDSVGTHIYYVTQTVQSCVSDMAAITVIVNPPPPPIQVGNNSPLCLGDTARLVVDSAAAATYTWTGPNGFSSTQRTPEVPDIVIADSGKYRIQLLVKGCPVQDATTNVRIDQVIANIGIDTDKVCISAPVNIRFTGIAPDTGTTYTWNFAGAAIENGSAKGPYIVKWDTLGTKQIILDVSNWRCDAKDTQTIKVSFAPQAAFSMKKNVCLNDTASIQVASYSLQNASNLIWQFDSATIADGGTAGFYVASWNTPGQKIVQLSIDYPECVRGPIADTITVHNPPNAAILNSTSREETICVGDSVTFTATSDSGYSYEWSPAYYFPSNLKNSNTAIGIIQASGDIYLRVTDQYGCTVQDSMYISTQPCCIVAFPSAFTPNGNGLNDVFLPKTIGHHQVKIFKIVNRWGQTVFESKTETEGWDGKFNGVPQDIGTYFWYINYQCDGKTIEQKGEVTLIR